MDINTFIDNMKDQFDDLSNELTPGTVYADLDGWSSIVALSVISMIDDEYDVQVKGSEIRNTETIQELFDLVQSKMA